MTVFHVGNGFTAWDFKDAYNRAKDGDIIQFSKDYHYILPQGKIFTISKNLHFIGTIEVSSQGQNIYTNTLLAKFVISDGATVTIENLWLEPGDNRSCIAVTEKAQLSLINVVINNTEANYDKYLIAVNQQSSININQSSIREYRKNCTIHINQSTVTITDSNINVKLLAENNSHVSLTNTIISHKHGNTILCTNSEIEINKSTINGAPAENDWPAIWLDKTSSTITNSIITQKDFVAAVRLNNSSLVADSNRFSSLKAVDHCLIHLNNTEILTQLYLSDDVALKSSGNLTIKGETDGKIEAFIGNNSLLISDNMTLHRISNPNIRISDRSFVHFNSLQLVNGNPVSIGTEVDPTSTLSQSKNPIQAPAPTNNGISGTGTVASNTESQTALEALNSLTGLNRVKQEINKMLRLVEFNKQREAQGLKVEKQALHSVFMGNPGTGKTTVARLMGQILFDNGVLTGEQFSFHEVSQEDLVSQNVGGTAPQTRKWLDMARGGVLFIDEAYNLYKKEGINHGQEAIDTIMKYMEDHRDEIMIIFAGYTKEMEQFLKSNPGLESRVPNHFHFEDYSPDEIVEMGLSLLTKDQYQLEDPDYYTNQVKRAYNNSLDHSNGRWIRNFNQKLTLSLANRVIQTGDTNITTILNSDISEVLEADSFHADQNADDALTKLNNLIGISKVKEQVLEFIALAEMNQKRAEAGFKTDDFSLHSLFLGNPGTGKTTVARIIGTLLYQKGIIKQNKFVEVSRSELVAGYIGQTAIKTREVLESALGGVLFIDEAYSLNSGSSNDFGKEAIDEILKFMEDHRKDMVIIFAGYTKEMSDFLRMNSGLTSRIPNTFDFEDYSPDEIVQIGLLHLHQSDYQVDEQLYAQTVITTYQNANDHSNGRWIRNFNEKLIRQLSLRLSSSSVELDQYNLITDEDLTKMKQ